MVNNGYDKTRAAAAGAADLVAYGKPFISNSDLVERLRQSASLNEFDGSTLYGGGERGYTDYPTLQVLSS